jgi:hypothetical protein
MDSTIHAGFVKRNFVYPLLIFILTATAIIVIHDINASSVSAQTAPCTQIADPYAIPSPKILTFDNLKDGTALSTQYQAAFGVIFPNQKPAPVIHAVSAKESDTPASPPNVVQNAIIAGTPRSPLVVGFTFPRTYVGMYLGNGMAVNGGPVIAQVTMMDANGGTLCTFRVTNVTLPHTAFAGAYDSLGRISSVSIAYGQTTNMESIDNLYVAPGLAANARRPLPTWTPLPTLKPTTGPTPTATPVLPLFPVAAYHVPQVIVPVVIKPNFSIFNIEITQGIQCFQGVPSDCGGDNKLSQVLNKSTVARVYIRANDSHSFYPNVPVRLHILAFGKEYTIDGAGKSTSSINQGVHDSADFYFTAYSGAPATIQFWAEVDPDHIYNTSYSNPRYPSVGTIVMNFDNRRTFTVAGERLYYHPSGYSGANYAGGWAVNGGAAEWWNQVLPLSDNAINYFVRSGYLDWTTNLSSGDAQHALIGTLNWMWMQENGFAWLFGTGPFTGVRHVYGWAPAAGYSGGHADMPVYPHAGGLGVVGIGSDAPGTSTDNPGSGALIFGHELTHDYNIKHTNTTDSCGSNDSSSVFPYGSSSIQAFGFNTLTGKIYDPNFTHDLMSYCPSGGSKLGWISPYTWNAMFNNLNLVAVLTAPPVSPILGNAVQDGTLVQTAATQSLIVNATINNPGTGSTYTGHLGHLQRISSGLAYPVPSGTFAVEELDVKGGLLNSMSFNVNFTSEYHEAGSGFTPPPFSPADTGAENVSFIMPFADGTRSIRLVYNGPTQQVLDTRVVSLNAPQVTITSPVNPVNWPAKSTQILSWTGSSLDKLPLTYSIYYSNNGGVSWVILASDLTASSYNVIVDSMAGGSDVRFRVVASDGINTGFDETPATIIIPNHPPQPIISDPVANGLHAPGDLIVFHGIATDMEDGTLPDASMHWSDSVQGSLGIGPTVPINNMKPGKHTITLTATDSYGVSNSTTVTIFVGYGEFLPKLSK